MFKNNTLCLKITHRGGVKIQKFCYQVFLLDLSLSLHSDHKHVFQCDFEAKLEEKQAILKFSAPAARSKVSRSVGVGKQLC